MKNHLILQRENEFARMDAELPHSACKRGEGVTVRAYTLSPEWPTIKMSDGNAIKKLLARIYSLRGAGMLDVVWGFFFFFFFGHDRSIGINSDMLAQYSCTCRYCDSPS